MSNYKKLSEKIRTMNDRQLSLLLFFCVGTLYDKEKDCERLLNQANSITETHK